MNSHFKEVARKALEKAESDALSVDEEFHCTESEYLRTRVQLHRIEFLREYLGLTGDDQ